jgi:hypothetical protein
MHSVVSIVPEAPSGITHVPDSHTPLAQSGPVSQLVFGSGTDGMQSPPLHWPLWQSLACVQDEPARAPGAPPELPPAAFSPPLFEPPDEIEPPAEVVPPAETEPPVDIELCPPAPVPPLELWQTPETHGLPAQSCGVVQRPPGEPLPPCSLEPHATATPPANTKPSSPA